LVCISWHLSPAHKYLPSLCLYMYPTLAATQRLRKNVIAATNTHATIDESLDASSSMRSVLYQGKYAISSSQNVLFPECCGQCNFRNTTFAPH
jgi:hypothetical protein